MRLRTANNNARRARRRGPRYKIVPFDDRTLLTIWMCDHKARGMSLPRCPICNTVSVKLSAYVWYEWNSPLPIVETTTITHYSQ